MLRFKNVSKSFGGKIEVLRNLNFEIVDKEFVFLVGPSGAGKTTILRLILRDFLPTEGEIFVDDFELKKIRSGQIPLLRRTLGIIFQDFKVLFERTVFENVAVALEILGKGKKEIKKEAEEALESVGILDKENYFPIQLSAGEVQRLSIARAIVGNPKIILADEPTGNLDPAASWGILKILNNINKTGKTVLMATHNIDIVNSMKKRVIALDKGKIVRDEKEGKYV